MKCRLLRRGANPLKSVSISFVTLLKHKRNIYAELVAKKKPDGGAQLAILCGVTHNSLSPRREFHYTLRDF